MPAAMNILLQNEPRPCERQCQGPCGEWKHHSRFRSWKDYRYRTVSVFSPECRACEQKARNEKKNADRPLAIIRNRAKAAAARSRVPTDFIWQQMNYAALVPLFRAMITDEGACLNCGHGFLNERDIQIEHIEPPRGPKDWARLHARNLRLFCGSCNGTKSNKPYADWLDEQEGARLSNLEEKQEPRRVADDLFSNLPKEARGGTNLNPNLAAPTKNRRKA